MILREDKNKSKVEYRVGEKVWQYTLQKSTIIKTINREEMKLAKKLKFSWQDPYEVVKQLTPNTVQLRYTNGMRLKQFVHVNRLKSYLKRQPTDHSQLEQEDDFDPSEEELLLRKKNHHPMR
jgi:hypothetical protein